MPRLRRAAGALALLHALAAPAPARPVDTGPLGVGTPGPLRGLFLDMPLADARPAAAPRLELRWAVANGWSKPTPLVRGGDQVEVQADAQSEELTLAVTIPWDAVADGALARRARTTVEARALVWWGGWTDRPIEAWHALVGAWNFERQLHARDAVRLRLAEPEGATLADVRGARAAAADLALRTQLQLAGGAPEDRVAAALRLDLKLPVGAVASLTGSGGWDVGAGLAATAAPLPWLTVHALASVRRVSDLPRRFALQPRRWQGGLDLSLVARLGRRVALVLEDRISSPLMERGWRLADGVVEPEATAWYALFHAHNQVSGGVRVGEVTVFFSEDFTPGARIAGDPGPRWFYDSNAPDFVLGVAWARVLR